MKVLFAYDGFPHSRHALKEVAELAANGDAEVTIISVVPEAEARGSKAGRRRWLLPHAHQDVAIAQSYLHEQGVEAEMKIAYGDPADEIRKEAAWGGYGTIVLGSRGRDRLGRLLLGSVSKKLVEEAPCPVLIAGKDVTVRHEAGSSDQAGDADPLPGGMVSALPPSPAAPHGTRRRLHRKAGSRSPRGSRRPKAGDGKRPRSSPAYG
jgi:nucleotide-binding universal stress UspA family protein